MDIKAEKKEAACFLNRRGRRIDFVFFGLLLIFAWMIPVFLFNYVTYLVCTFVIGFWGHLKFTKLVANLLSAVSPAVGVIFAVLSLIFITLPVMHRFFSFSYRMHRQGIAGREGFFCGGESYKKSLSKGAVSSGVLILCAVPGILFYNLARLLVKSSDEMISTFAMGIFAFVVMAGIVLGFFVFVLFRPIFLYGYFSAKGEKVDSAIKKSIKIMKTEKAKALYKGYIKSFVLELLLAIPTFLVLFFVDTLPKMTLVYYRLCDELLYGEEI